LSSAIESPKPEEGHRRRRVLKRVGIGVAITLGVLLLVVFVLPTPIARYVIDSQLDQLGIEHDGIETIDIDLWNSEVRAGPMGFHAGDAPDGQIGRVAFDYSFGALFKGRGFVSVFVISGVDLRAARHADGAITLNGVNLSDIAGTREEAAEESESPPSDSGPGFNVGVERFVFRDSKLFFEDLSGGDLVMDLERLTLDSLSTWSPDEPTQFTIEGSLNDMQLAIGGTVSPLADPMRISIDSKINGITIERLARFVGPVGLERRDGNLEARVHYDYTIHRDGRIEGEVDGTYRLTGFDIATPGGAVVKLDEAILTLDLAQTLSADGSATASGQLQLEGTALSASSAAGDALEIGALALNVENLDLSKQAERRRSLLDWTSDTGGSRNPQGAQSIVRIVMGALKLVARDFLSHVFEVNGRPTLSLEDGRARLAARGETPARELEFRELEVALEDLESHAFDAGVRGSVGLATAVKGLRAADDDGALEATIANVQLDSKAIEVSVTSDQTTISFDASTILESLAARGARFGSVSLQTMSLGSDGISLEDTLGAAFAGYIETSGLAFERSGSKPLTIGLSSSRTNLERMRIAPLDGQAVIEGDLVTTLSKISFEAGTNSGELSASLDTLEHGIADLRISDLDGDAPRVTLVERARLDGLEATLPLATGRTADVGLVSLTLPHAELTVEGSSIQGRASTLEMKGVTASTESDRPQSVDLAEIAATGLSASFESGLAIERITVGKLNAELTLPLQDAPAEGAKNASEPTSGSNAGAESEATPPPPGRSIKLGELSLAPGSTIVITDSTVKPPVQTNVVMEKLELGPLDTGAPGTRTNLDVAMAVNESAKVGVEGWASPLAPEPGLDLSARAKTISLPPFSPYAASLAGVNVESGTLWTSANARSDGKSLVGKIDLRIDELFVTPISEEEAKAIEANTGMPVGFAVGILKDDKGVIELGFPVSGTVAEPELDYSDAINKALSGAMASLFPSNWFGDDGGDFDMKPATFKPGTADLTAEGKAVVDHIGNAFANKPSIRVRACGRASRDDLMAMRGTTDTQSAAAALPPSPDESAETAQASVDEPAVAVAPPDEKEVESLLTLATRRVATIREYLKASHGIDAERVPDCRTAYSIEDGKPPRAEFLF
jgi:hypothetical protein